MKHLEIKTVETNGIKVVIKVDYDQQTISLVEILRANGSMQTPPKKWVFAERTIEYMDSWVNIFEAMKEAVNIAKKDLREFQKIKEKEMVVVLDKAMALVQKEKTKRK